jgi:hypothetical protein
MIAVIVTALQRYLNQIAKVKKHSPTKETVDLNNHHPDQKSKTFHLLKLNYLQMINNLRVVRLHQKQQKLLHYQNIFKRQILILKMESTILDRNLKIHLSNKKTN